MTKKRKIQKKLLLTIAKMTNTPSGTRRAAGKRALRKKKKMTQAAFDANRANGKKSAGPRTAAGKLTASRNAITHGFFARELILNDKETRQLEASRRRLQSQLGPKTELQALGLEEIKACIGRCKLALRLEMRHISRLLGQDSTQQAQSEQPERAGADWYLSGRQGLREGMRLLEAVKQEFLSLGGSTRNGTFCSIKPLVHSCGNS